MEIIIIINNRKNKNKKIVIIIFYCVDHPSITIPILTHTMYITPPLSLPVLATASSAVDDAPEKCELAPAATTLISWDLKEYMQGQEVISQPPPPSPPPSSRCKVMLIVRVMVRIEDESTYRGKR